MLSGDRDLNLLPLLRLRLRLPRELDLRLRASLDPLRLLDLRGLCLLLDRLLNFFIDFDLDRDRERFTESSAFLPRERLRLLDVVIVLLETV